MMQIFYRIIISIFFFVFTTIFTLIIKPIDHISLPQPFIEISKPKTSLHLCNDICLILKECKSSFVIFTLTNNSNKSIYVRANPINELTSDKLFYGVYSLLFKKTKNKQFIDYGPNWCEAPEFIIIQPGNSIDYKVDKIFIFNGICKVNIPYLDDYTIVRMINGEFGISSESEINLIISSWKEINSQEFDIHCT